VSQDDYQKGLQKPSHLQLASAPGSLPAVVVLLGHQISHPILRPDQVHPKMDTGIWPDTDNTVYFETA
jgi:hypothetical protein